MYQIAKLINRFKLNTLDRNGNTPLSLASRAGDLDKITELLDLGADIEGKDLGKYTPLLLAVYYNKFEAVELLVSRNAKLEANSGGIHNTPLLVAVKNGNYKLTEYLLSVGAKMTAKNKYHLTAKDIAEELGYADILDLLTRYEVLAQQAKKESKKVHKAYKVQTHKTDDAASLKEVVVVPTMTVPETILRACDTTTLTQAYAKFFNANQHYLTMTAQENPPTDTLADLHEFVAKNNKN